MVLIGYEGAEVVEVGVEDEEVSQPPPICPTFLAGPGKGEADLLEGSFDGNQNGDKTGYHLHRTLWHSLQQRKSQWWRS